MADTEAHDNPAFQASNDDITQNGHNDNTQNGHSNGHAYDNGVHGTISTSGLEVIEKDDRTEWEAEQQAKRDREPLRYIQWITNRPRTWFGKIYIIHSKLYKPRTIDFCFSCPIIYSHYRPGLAYLFFFFSFFLWQIS